MKEVGQNVRSKQHRTQEKREKMRSREKGGDDKTL
jgi:hypothetical protein